MKKASALLVLAVVAVAMMLAPVAWAADVEGKIKSVDPTGKMITLDDGTQLTIPPTLTVEKKALLPGANVKASKLLSFPDGVLTHGGGMIIQPDGPEALLVEMWVTQP